MSRKDNDLPACVYRHHGGYYLVKQNKWTRLGATMSEALVAYARIIDTPRDSVSALLDRVIEDAAERVAPSTLKQYKVAVEKLRAVFVEFRADQVRPKHIAQLMDHNRHTPGMANRMRSVLKLAFDQAVRVGLCPSNPVIAIARHKERPRDRYLTDAEYAAIWNAAPAPLRCIMDLCYLTAQRISDVLAIAIGDLTPEGIAIDQGKTGKKLLIRWNADLREAVATAKQLTPERKIARLDRPRYLLGQRNGNIRSYGGVRDLWRRACIRAGIENAHIHDIRAKSLTDANRQGLDAQHLAGHATEAMTLRYLRSKDREAVTGPKIVRRS